MAFTGWPVEAVEFYEGLETDNSKSYWHAHKSVYDQRVKAPMEALLAELADEFGEGRVFRPYRDTRFSADKTPYKLNCAAHLPGGYLSFSADGLFVGSGLYMPDAAQLQRFRDLTVGNSVLQLKVCNSSSHAQHAIVRAGAQLQALGGPRQ